MNAQDFNQACAVYEKEIAEIKKSAERAEALFLQFGTPYLLDEITALHAQAHKKQLQFNAYQMINRP